MTIALIILAVIAAIVIGLLLYASTQPNSFRVARSATIQAPVPALHAILSDLRRGAEWSPFEKGLTMEKSYRGPATGKGATMTWSGSKDVGAGTLTILDTTPSRLTLALDMLKPMKASNIVEYELVPQSDATVMTWSIHGPMTMMSKIMSLFMSIDKMCGDQFEKGLRDIKALAEREANPSSSAAA